MRDFDYIEDMNSDIFYQNSNSISHITIKKDNTGKSYATIKDMLYSGYSHAAFANKYTVSKDMNPSNNTWSDGGSDAFDGWGYLRMSDGNGNNDFYIPLKYYNGPDGVLYDNDFTYLGVNWHVCSGWTTSGIFLMDVYQTSGTPIQFKIKWHGNLGSDGSGSQYITVKNINSYGTNCNIYTHWNGGAGDPYITSTIVPYEIEKNISQPFIFSGDTAVNNFTSVSLLYGATLYIQWGYPAGGVHDVQNWIANDLNYSGIAGDKNNVGTGNNMITSFDSERESKPINISSVGAYNDSVLTWTQETPGDSYIELYADISFDNGTNWMGYRLCRQGQQFPGLLYGMDLNNTLVRFKLVMYANNTEQLPKYYGLSFSLYSAKIKFLVLDGDTVKHYVKYYEYLPISNNATTALGSNSTIALASSEFNDTYQAWKAFDHKNAESSDGWISQNGLITSWIQYDFGQDNSKNLYQYAIRPRNSYADITAVPKNWILYGSDDQLDWKIVDSRVNQIGWLPNEKRIFEVVNDNFYRYYRLNISANNGNVNYTSIGELEFYTNELTLVGGSWEEQTSEHLTDEIFEMYGFDNISELDFSKLYLMDKPRIATNITNTRYMPHLYLNGYKNTAFRYKTELVRPESINILQDWSDYDGDEVNNSYIIQPKTLSALDSYNFKVTAQQRDGKTIAKSQKLKLHNAPPEVTLKIIGSSTLSLNITDSENDKVRFRISLNSKQIYPERGPMSAYMSQPVNFKANFGGNDLNIGGTNVIDVVCEDENSLLTEKTITFVGNYGGIMFKDELGLYYTDDLGRLLQYLDFGTIMAGKKTWTQKVILQNKNGYAINNITLSTDQDIPNVHLGFSLTEKPFSNNKYLTFTSTLNPDDEKEFFVRLTTDRSDIPFGGNLCIYAKSDIVN